MKNWDNIINLETLEYKFNEVNANYCHESAPLATKMGSKKLGFHAEILPPKNSHAPIIFTIQKKNFSWY